MKHHGTLFRVTLIVTALAIYIASPFGLFSKASEPPLVVEDDVTNNEPIPTPLASQIAILNEDWKVQLLDEAKESYFEWFLDRETSKENRATKKGKHYDGGEKIELLGRALWPEEDTDNEGHGVAVSEEVMRKLIRHVGALEHEEWSEGDFGDANEDMAK